MSIRFKILLACFSLTAITVVFGLIARANQAELGSLAYRLYDDTFMSMSYLRSAQNTIVSMSNDLVDPSLSARERIEDQLDAAVSDLGVARDRALSPQAADAAIELHDQVVQLRHQIEGNHPADRSLVAQIADRFDSAVEVNAGDGFRSRRKAADLVSNVEKQTWSMTMTSVAVALLITYLLSKAIVPTVRQAVGIATNIAAGQLDNPIPRGASGETAILLRALAVMQRSIAEQIAQIQALLAQQASSHASELAVHNVRFETALDNMVQGLCLLDGDRRLLVHNRRFGDMFTTVIPGTDLAVALPASLIFDDEPLDLPQARAYTRTLADERIIAVSERPMETGGWVVTYEDVTERHQAETRLAHIARHDALTGLPNRLRFREELAAILADKSCLPGLAVLCCGLDHFKAVNEMFGHPVGDAVLGAVARRLSPVLGNDDMLVRLSGDEFAILHFGESQPKCAKDFAERLLLVMSAPLHVAGQTMTISMSIGIALFSQASNCVDTLLNSAELALDRAKTDGRATFRFFEAEVDARIQARRQLEIDLRRAVEDREFAVYYQPLVTTATRSIGGVEALVRWLHPTRGMVSPAEFIPVAEEIGLIGKVGQLVLEQACRDAARWPACIKVAVNLSPLQFQNLDLATDVAAVLEMTGLAANRLELEITESVLLQDGDQIMTILHRLQRLGVRISMDDFGTGYSSLSYLRRFPFNKIKIDQSFVRNLDDTNDGLAIVRAVLGLGRSLGMRVVAEGVETEEQYALLHREGCEQLQGYLFSKPVPVTAISAMIAADEQLVAA